MNGNSMPRIVTYVDLNMAPGRQSITFQYFGKTYIILLNCNPTASDIAMVTSESDIAINGPEVKRRLEAGTIKKIPRSVGFIRQLVGIHNEIHAARQRAGASLYEKCHQMLVEAASP